MRVGKKRINSRDKGIGFEHDIANQLKKHFPECARNWMEQSDKRFACADFEKGKAGSIAPDIYVRGVYIQCKKGGQSSGETGRPIDVFLDYEQRAMAYAVKKKRPNLLTVLCWKKDRHNTYAMIRAVERYKTMLNIPINDYSSMRDDLVVIYWDDFVADLVDMCKRLNIEAVE